MDLEELTQQLVEETTEYLILSPVGTLESIIYHDELHTLCNQKAIDILVAEAENKSEELKYQNWK